MPAERHYDQVASVLLGALGKRQFHTVQRSQVTDLLRSVSGEPDARLTGERAGRLQRRLEAAGVTCCPDLETTTTTDSVRLVRKHTVAHEVVRAVERPGMLTDKRLAEFITKIQGRWHWDTVPSS